MPPIINSQKREKGQQVAAEGIAYLVDVNCKGKYRDYAVMRRKFHFLFQTNDSRSGQKI